MKYKETDYSKFMSEDTEFIRLKGDLVPCAGDLLRAYVPNYRIYSMKEYKEYVKDPIKFWRESRG